MRLAQLDAELSDRKKSATHIAQLAALQQDMRSTELRSALTGNDAAPIVAGFANNRKALAAITAHASASFKTTHNQSLDDIDHTLAEASKRLASMELTSFNVALGKALKIRVSLQFANAIDSKDQLQTFESTMANLTARSADDVGLANIASPVELQSWREHVALRGAFLANFSVAAQVVSTAALGDDSSAPPLDMDAIVDLCGEMESTSTCEKFRERVLAAGVVVAADVEGAATSLYPTVCLALQDSLAVLTKHRLASICKKPNFQAVVESANAFETAAPADNPEQLVKNTLKSQPHRK